MKKEVDSNEKYMCVVLHPETDTSTHNNEKACTEQAKALSEKTGRRVMVVKQVALVSPATTFIIERL